MQHKTAKRDRRLINPGTVTITEHGYLAGIPTNGPGLVMRSKVLKLVFEVASSLGWDVRIAKQSWGR
jgi:hypothetical protein